MSNRNVITLTSPGVKRIWHMRYLVSSTFPYPTCLGYFSNKYKTVGLFWAVISVE